MRAVHKYVFDIAHGGELNIDLGEYFKVVHVGLDPATGEPAMWVEHFPGADQKHSRRFMIVGTGHQIGDPFDHVGSVVHGRYVWHVYVRKDRVSSRWMPDPDANDGGDDE